MTSTTTSGTPATASATMINPPKGLTALDRRVLEDTGGTDESYKALQASINEMASNPINL
ncbi:hypothetical protein FRC08_018075, partial [Ceratobasidium sp. 394]